MELGLSDICFNQEAFTDEALDSVGVGDSADEDAFRLGAIVAPRPNPEAGFTETKRCKGHAYGSTTTTLT